MFRAINPEFSGLDQGKLAVQCQEQVKCHRSLAPNKFLNVFPWVGQLVLRAVRTAPSREQVKQVYSLGTQ